MRPKKSFNTMMNAAVIVTVLNPAMTVFADTGLFKSHVDYSTGLGPYSLKIADLNYDGKLDLVTSNYGHNAGNAAGNTVSILLGKGDGTFASNVEHLVGDSPIDVQVADLNADGDPDVVTVNYDANTISVLLGKGKAAFRAKVDYPVNSNPLSAAIADINRDGYLDVVVANYSSSNVSVLIGKGDGTFKTKLDVPTDYTPRDVKIADLNSDGKLDVVTANYGGGGGTTLSMLLGKGNGKFKPMQNFTTNSGTTSVQIADINRDGKLDLIAASYDYGGLLSPANPLSVLLGNGRGNFQPKVDYPIDGRLGLQLSDLNRDGWLDAVAVGSGGASVLLSDRNNGFLAQDNYGVGNGVNNLQLGDVNHDGKLDIVTVNYESNSVSVLLGN